MDCVFRSQYLVINVAKTEGCYWELNQLGGLFLNKVIFIISSLDAYTVFKSKPPVSHVIES